jgi:hypothetical protein
MQYLVTSSSSSFRQFYPSSIFSEGHPVSGYIFFFVVPAVLSFLYFFFNDVKMLPIHLAFLLFYGMYDISLLLDSMLYFFILHTVVPTDLLNPSPAQHFKTFQIFLIYLSKFANFSTIQNYVPSVALC